VKITSRFSERAPHFLRLVNWKSVQHELTPCPESSSELHRSSDRRLSAKLVPIFCGQRVPRGQRDELQSVSHRLARSLARVGSFALMMEATCSSETSLYNPIRRHFPEDGVLHSLRCEHLKSHKTTLLCCANAPGSVLGATGCCSWHITHSNPCFILYVKPCTHIARAPRAARLAKWIPASYRGSRGASQRQSVL
jgi:hypothetical protein